MAWVRLACDVIGLVCVLVLSSRIRKLERVAVALGDFAWRAVNVLGNGPTRERGFAAMDALEGAPKYIRDRVNALAESDPGSDEN